MASGSLMECEKGEEKSLILSLRSSASFSRSCLPDWHKTNKPVKTKTYLKNCIDRTAHFSPNLTKSGSFERKKWNSNYSLISDKKNIRESSFSAPLSRRTIHSPKSSSPREIKPSNFPSHSTKLKYLEESDNKNFMRNVQIPRLALQKKNTFPLEDSGFSSFDSRSTKSSPVLSNRPIRTPGSNYRAIVQASFRYRFRKHDPSGHKPLNSLPEEKEALEILDKATNLAAEGNLSTSMIASLFQLPVTMEVTPSSYFVGCLWQSMKDEDVELSSLKVENLITIGWSTYLSDYEHKVPALKRILEAVKPNEIINVREAFWFFKLCTYMCCEENDSTYYPLMGRVLKFISENLHLSKPEELIQVLQTSTKMNPEWKARYRPILESLISRLNAKLPSTKDELFASAYEALGGLDYKGTPMTPNFDARRSFDKTDDQGGLNKTTKLSSTTVIKLKKLTYCNNLTNSSAKPTLLTERLPTLSPICMLKVLRAVAKLDYRHPQLIEAAHKLVSRPIDRKKFQASDCIGLLEVSIWANASHEEVLDFCKFSLPAISSKDFFLLYYILSTLTNTPTSIAIVPKCKDSQDFHRDPIMRKLADADLPSLTEFFVCLQKLDWPKEDTVVTACADLLSKRLDDMSFRELCIVFVSSLHFGVHHKFDCSYLQKCQQGQDLSLGEPATVVLFMKTLAATCSSSDEIRERALFILQEQDFSPIAKNFSAEQCRVYANSCSEIKWRGGLTKTFFSRIKHLLQDIRFPAVHGVETMKSIANLFTTRNRDLYGDALESLVDTILDEIEVLTDAELVLLLNCSGKLNIRHEAVLNALGVLPKHRLSRISILNGNLMSPEMSEDEE
eukprot:GHVP01024999.1.p1 GENE.GHVP01024999.1~~GHVP01024999.1.p1  ORF type:complete len:845 (-),score=108.61 GHVP01024999.1:280-2814(-)